MESEKYVGYSMGVTYEVHYKNPRERNHTPENIMRYVGNLENLITGKIHSFLNDDGEILHVHYNDIVQMRRTK